MSAATRTVRVRACAKVNLTLRVLGIRPDGYHELRTTFQSLALYDTLTFTAVPGSFRITSDDPACPTDSTNLVWKAAHGIWRASGRKGTLRGVHVHIRKRIPALAGLGGGSSDGAAALRALPLLWRGGPPEDTIESIARELGADVAFFLGGGTALGVDRGDLLFPLQDARPAWVVLARPDFGISTRDAYGWWDDARRTEPADTRRRPTLRAEWVNDLQAPVGAHHPRIPQLVRKLDRLGARFSAMSGSGSAVFGLFDDRKVAEQAAASVQDRRVASWLTRTLSHREYLRVSAPRLF